MWRAHDIAKGRMPPDVDPEELIEVELVDGIRIVDLAEDINWSSTAVPLVRIWRRHEKGCRSVPKPLPETSDKYPAAGAPPKSLEVPAEGRWEIHTSKDRPPLGIGPMARVDVVLSNNIMRSNALLGSISWSNVSYWRFAKPGSPQRARRIEPLKPDEIVYRDRTYREIPKAEYDELDPKVDRTAAMNPALGAPYKSNPETSDKYLAAGMPPKKDGITAVLDSQVGGDHYKKHEEYQPWEVLRHWLTAEEFRGFMKGSAIVYLARERDKGGDTDIEKADHYLRAMVEYAKAANDRED